MPCKYNDCGWCYHEDGPEDGCTGIDKCSIINNINNSMKSEDQLKAMKSIRKPMPKPTVAIKNKKREKLDKTIKKEIE